MDMSELSQDDPFAGTDAAPPVAPAQGAVGNYGAPQPPSHVGQGPAYAHPFPLTDTPVKKRVIIQAAVDATLKDGRPFKKYTAGGIQFACFKKDCYPVLDAALQAQKEIEVSYTGKQNGNYTNYQIVGCEGVVDKPKGSYGGGRGMFTDKQAAAIATSLMFQGRPPNPDEYSMMFNAILVMVKE